MLILDGNKFTVNRAWLILFQLRNWHCFIYNWISRAQGVSRASDFPSFLVENPNIPLQYVESRNTTLQCKIEPATRMDMQVLRLIGSIPVVPQQQNRNRFFYRCLCSHVSQTIGIIHEVAAAQSAANETQAAQERFHSATSCSECFTSSNMSCLVAWTESERFGCFEVYVIFELIIQNNNSEIIKTVGSILWNNRVFNTHWYFQFSELTRKVSFGTALVHVTAFRKCLNNYFKYFFRDSFSRHTCVWWPEMPDLKWIHLWEYLGFM